MQPKSLDEEEIMRSGKYIHLLALFVCIITIMCVCVCVCTYIFLKILANSVIINFIHSY